MDAVQRKHYFLLVEIWHLNNREGCWVVFHFVKSGTQVREVRNGQVKFVFETVLKVAELGF